MALFGTSGGLIGTALSAVGGLFGGSLGGVAQIAGGAISSLVATQTAIPAVSGGPVVQQPLSQTVALPMAAAGSVARMVAPILAKIAAFLGKRSVTLSRALSMVRAMSKYLTPAATGAALGITLNELASLIVASRQRRRRRMNPTNVRALRRSMRRLESFHKLCVRADSLRSRGRSRKSRSCAQGSPLIVRGG